MGAGAWPSSRKHRRRRIVWFAARSTVDRGGQDVETLPELFAFGLLEDFDIVRIAALGGHAKLFFSRRMSE